MNSEVVLIKIKNHINEEIKLRNENINKYLAKTKFFNKNNQQNQPNLNSQKIKFNITSYDDSNLFRYLSNKYSNNHMINILENDFSLEKEKRFNDLNLIINFMRYIFARYHNKIGGQLFEDEWIMYSGNKSQTKYELNKNELIFDNSINLVYRKDINTINYIRKLQDLFQEVTKESKYKVSLKMIEDEKHHIIIVAFMVKERK